MNRLLDKKMLLVKQETLARFSNNLAFQRLASVLIVRESSDPSISPFNDRVIDALTKSFEALERNEDWDILIQNTSLCDDDFITIVEEIDPSILIILDRSSASRIVSLSTYVHSIDETYPVGSISSCFENPLVQPMFFSAEGRFCLAFENFETLLGDSNGKQKAWHALKQLKNR